MLYLKNRQQHFLKLVVFALFLPLLSGCGKCDRIKSDDPFAKASCLIEQLMKNKNIFSFQVAVAKDGDIIYEEAFGWANVEKQIRTTPKTMHLVASISKPFTSTSLMILAERGQIDLHGPVNEYLGDTKLIAYQGDAADATVARMLLHTTGLPYGYYICGDIDPWKNIKRPEIYSILRACWCRRLEHGMNIAI
jgi:CubicO group peptidase (beta-lactamase class C family)